MERQERLSPVVLANGSSIQKPLYEAMAERMKDGCFRFANVPLESGIDIKFIPELFTLTISDLGSAGFPLYRLVSNTKSREGVGLCGVLSTSYQWYVRVCLTGKVGQ